MNSHENVAEAQTSGPALLICQCYAKLRITEVVMGGKHNQNKLLLLQELLPLDFQTLGAE